VPLLVQPTFGDRANGFRNGNSSTMNDDARPATPALPYDDLRSALGDDPAARTELDALHAHLGEPHPDPVRIKSHVDALRGVREAEAHVANWWDDPVTQSWIKALGDAGL
jgi:hypothetical protein